MKVSNALDHRARNVMPNIEVRLCLFASTLHSEFFNFVCLLLLTDCHGHSSNLFFCLNLSYLDLSSSHLIFFMVILMLL